MNPLPDPAWTPNPWNQGSGIRRTVDSGPFSLKSIPRQGAPRFIEREPLVTLVRASLAVDEPRFARRLALAWLTAYPGDLEVSLLHAQALMQIPPPARAKSASHLGQAVAALENVCAADPEYLEAQQARLECRKAAGMELSEENLGSVLALGGPVEDRNSLPAWGFLLKKARQTLDDGKPDMAEYLVHQALLANANIPLIASFHLKIEQLRGLPQEAVRSLAAVYAERFPLCLHFSLVLADCLMDGGEPDKAVSLLHQAAARDVTGKVPRSLWGDSFPFKGLWPENLRLPWPTDLSVPGAVAAVFGWNQLPSNASSPGSASTQGVSIDCILDRDGIPLSSTFPWQPDALGAKMPKSASPETEVSQPTSARHLPEELKSVQEELEKVAENLRQPLLGRLDGRFPVYVILTTRKGLENLYGQDAADRIIRSLKAFAAAVAASRKMDALVFTADEGYSELFTAPKKGAALDGQPLNLGVKPARHSDPWSIKLALADLDAALSKRGQMLGALLIAGGPEVVPFHRLPNPVDDADADVPSDNPYGTRDENYFIPEWPVGRLAAGCSPEPETMLAMIASLEACHKTAPADSLGFWSWLKRLFAGMHLSRDRRRRSHGYTAAIWKQASASVFRPVGEARSLLVSPPICANGHTGALTNAATKKQVALRPARLGYFNLHGLPDAVEWFGQSDPADPFPGGDYPVALRPQDIGAPPTEPGGDPTARGSNGAAERSEPQANDGSRSVKAASQTPDVVFSEACYGAHIYNRTVDEAIALKFMASGSQAFAGSTCIAYGSIAAPLAAADLLGHSFWSHVKDGIPAGEALRRAKIHLAKEMHKRQGYLDGEDQKTLISFVLYGDPLARPIERSREVRPIFRSLKPPAQVKTVCEHPEAHENSSLPPETMTYVKHVVARYLPGMTDAALAITQEHAGCDGGDHQCPTAQLGAKSVPSRLPDRKVVTLSKSVKGHRHYARLTLDGSGKMVKLVVSR